MWVCGGRRVEAAGPGAKTPSGQEIDWPLGVRPGRAERWCGNPSTERPKGGSVVALGLDAGTPTLARIRLHAHRSRRCARWSVHRRVPGTGPRTIDARCRPTPRQASTTAASTRFIGSPTSWPRTPSRPKESGRRCSPRPATAWSKSTTAESAVESIWRSSRRVARNETACSRRTARRLGPSVI